MHAGHIPGFVKIIPVASVHGNDLASIGIFHDYADILGAHSLIEAVHIFFYDLLGSHIKRGHDTVAVRRLYNRLFHAGITVHISVLASVRSHQGAVVIAFDPHVRHIPGKGKADRVAGQRLERIRSEVIFLKPYAFYIFSLCLLRFRKCAVFRYGSILFKSILLIHGKLFFQDLILAFLGIAVCETVADIRFVQPQNCGQGPDGRFDVFRIRIHCLTVQDHIIYFIAGGKDIAVLIIDIAPPCRQHTVLIPLLRLGKHLTGISVSACGIDISDPCQQTN